MSALIEEHIFGQITSNKTAVPKIVLLRAQIHKKAVVIYQGHLSNSSNFVPVGTHTVFKNGKTRYCSGFFHF
jgi:hypothetical protein